MFKVPFIALFGLALAACSTTQGNDLGGSGTLSNTGNNSVSQGVSAPDAKIPVSVGAGRAVASDDTPTPTAK